MAFASTNLIRAQSHVAQSTLFAVTEPAHPLDGPALGRSGGRPGDRRFDLVGAPHHPAPVPPPPRNVRFVALGRAYLPQLGVAYAAAWEEGAKQLEAGGDISDAVDTVAKSWSANRVQLYNHVLTPEFSKIVVESVKDSDVTPVERSAMAAAWRGLAAGLGK